MNLPQACVTLKDYLSDVYTIGELDPAVRFLVQSNCTADDTPLRVVATLVGRGGSQKIRVGCCPRCGYIGYLDRVTKDWLLHYNSEIWDNPDQVDIHEEIRERRHGCSAPDIRRCDTAMRLVRMATIDRLKPVCEIGTGYGRMLKCLAQAGFSQAIGMETSRHRAEIARHAYGLEVLHGAFEDPRVQARLGSLAPIGLFYSHHVLEHTYDPGEILTLAAGLQDDGDFLISILPNFLGEPTIATLFFLGHQHLFTPVALERLLNRTGYEITDDSLSTHRELAIVAKRVAHPQRRYPDEGLDYVRRAVEKFASAMKLWRPPRTKHRGLWGSLYHAINRDRYFYRRRSLGVLHRWFERSIRRRRGVVGTYAAIIGPGQARLTEPEASPLEIQFDGNIRLLH